jgi:hypothetical protein
MDKVTSESVRDQLDYKIMMQYINDMLEKESPEGSRPGSINLGKNMQINIFPRLMRCFHQNILI